MFDGAAARRQAAARSGGDSLLASLAVGQCLFHARLRAFERCGGLFQQGGGLSDCCRIAQEP